MSGFTKEWSYVWVPSAAGVLIGVLGTVLVDAIGVELRTPSPVVLGLVIGFFGLLFGLLGLTVAVLVLNQGTVQEDALNNRRPQPGESSSNDVDPAGAAGTSTSHDRSASGRHSGEHNPSSRGADRGHPGAIQPPAGVEQEAVASIVPRHGEQGTGARAEGGRSRSESGARPSMGGEPQDHRTSGNSENQGVPGGMTEERDGRRAPLLDPGGLIDAWVRYLEEGDGHFEAQGLRDQLEAVGVNATVVPGKELGVGDAVLGVCSPEDHREVYLLPNFGHSPRAVADWFVDEGSGARTSKIKRLTRVAVVERQGHDLEVRYKGAVA